MEPKPITILDDPWGPEQKGAVFFVPIPVLIAALEKCMASGDVMIDTGGVERALRGVSFANSNPPSFFDRSSEEGEGDGR